MENSAISSREGKDSLDKKHSHSTVVSTYRIDSDSLTNPSLLHPFYFAHLFPSSRYRYRTNDVKTISIRKKKKKRTLNPSLNPSFRSSFSITISSTKKTKDRATLLSPFPHFPLVLSPPRGKNYSVDESQSREQGG